MNHLSCGPLNRDLTRMQLCCSRSELGFPNGNTFEYTVSALLPYSRVWFLCRRWFLRCVGGCLLIKKGVVTGMSATFVGRECDV